MSKEWTARNWWGAAWVEKMERLAERTRFAGGALYARTNSVTGVRFDGRTIVAKVQPPKEPPYTVRISFDPFSRDDWERLMAEVRDRKALAESLSGASPASSGDLPLEIQTAFSKTKLRFMPERFVDLHLECACADWLKPCKHLVAVWLQFAREFDRDPLLVFELRGLKREELLSMLLDQGEAAGPVAAGEEEFPEIAVPLNPEPLPGDAEAFWCAPPLPAATPEPSGRRLLDDDVFERLRNWPGVESQFHQIYDWVYELASLLSS